MGLKKRDRVSIITICILLVSVKCSVDMTRPLDYNDVYVDIQNDTVPNYNLKM